MVILTSVNSPLNYSAVAGGDSSSTSSLTNRYVKSTGRKTVSNATSHTSSTTVIGHTINAHVAAEHNIEFYADRLFLSPRYMSTVVKKVSGRSAKEWIDDALVARIKVALRYTDRQAAQISDDFGFPNTSFFSKFFKRLTGLTPLQYRQS